MICPNCGNITSNGSACEFCGYPLYVKKKRSSFRTIALISVLVVCVGLLLWSFSINYFSFHGFSSEKVSAHGYSSPALLIHDYIKYISEDKPRYVLSTYHPEIVAYYSEYYNKNEDILWAADAAYRNGIYEYSSSHFIDKEIDWTEKFYQGELQAHNIHCSAGKDIRMIFYFDDTSFTGSKSEAYYFEMVKENGLWYMISVYK
jgi:hypothetical protein